MRADQTTKKPRINPGKCFDDSSGKPHHSLAEAQNAELALLIRESEAFGKSSTEELEQLTAFMLANADPLVSILKMTPKTRTRSPNGSRKSRIKVVENGIAVVPNA